MDRSDFPTATHLLIASRTHLLPAADTARAVGMIPSSQLFFRIALSLITPENPSQPRG
jgi:hypothetical protein